MVKRITRKLALLADFEDGYAKGWYFAVQTAFRDQLDIRYTERVENKKTVMRWTQGDLYAFDIGHIIYQDPAAHLVEGNALKQPCILCQVVSAIPNKYDENGNFIDGYVHFELYQNYTKVATHQTTQNNFVEYLKTGTLLPKGAIQ